MPVNISLSVPIFLRFDMWTIKLLQMTLLAKIESLCWNKLFLSYASQIQVNLFYQFVYVLYIKTSTINKVYIS